MITSLKPSDIYYSQKSISNKFGKDTRHGDKHIGETLDEICEGKTLIGSIPLISVVKRSDKWVTCDNRRLWIFKQLERLWKCGDIRVKVKKSIDRRKCNSKDGGNSVKIRGDSDPGGLWYKRATPHISTAVHLNEDHPACTSISPQFKELHISRPPTENQDYVEKQESNAIAVPLPSTENESSNSIQNQFNLNASIQNRNRDRQTLTEENNKERLLVAAIDFGTTNCGYAFSFRSDFLNDPLKIITNTWDTGSGTYAVFKAPSCILFDRCQQFDSFGFEAAKKYAQLVSGGTHREWYFFKHFKMLLYNNRILSRRLLLKDDKGQTMSAMTVFSECIKYLKGHLMETCMHSGYIIHKTDVQWVLTVPAIWDEAAKQFMKESAAKAGIPSQCISLALEPEAASIYCKHMAGTREDNDDGDEQGLEFSIDPGTKYIMIDAGGGTVDITIHEKQSDETLKELYKPSGGPWGGTKVDEAFYEFLKKIFGCDVMESFIEHDGADYLDLVREFERKKQQLHPLCDTTLSFKMPSSIFEAYERVIGSKFRCSSLLTKSHQINLLKDKLQIHPNQMKALFTETCDRIVTYVREMLGNLIGREVDTMLMVGGFSESRMLQHAIREAFPLKTIITLADASMAVLKGAVIFGHNPEVIGSRVSKYTYGIKVLRPFIPSVHPESKRTKNEGEYMCSDCFDKHVEIGQEIHIGKVFNEETYVPLSKLSTQACLSVYSSISKYPKYVDEAGCTNLGTLTVDLPDTGSYEKRIIYVRMIYGGTELGVEARIGTTGKTLRAKFDFLG